jgi:ribonuclease-3 family protein
MEESGQPDIPKVDLSERDNDHLVEVSPQTQASVSNISLFGSALLSRSALADVSPKSLAHLGDAVFHLFERERELRLASSAKQMHIRARVSAQTQSDLLEKISPYLSGEEADIVRRARNVRATTARRAEQVAYRRATAFEALLGYLYLNDPVRLRSVLAMTLDT